MCQYQNVKPSIIQNCQLSSKRRKQLNFDLQFANLYELFSFDYVPLVTKVKRIVI